MAPAVPVIVSMYCPGAAADVGVIESIELNVGVPDVGLSDAETPFGAPDTVKATF